MKGRTAGGIILVAMSSSSGPSDRLPSVSVVIPARSAAQAVAGAVASALDQDYPALTEVVVAAADEPTADAARSLEDPRVKVVANPNGSTPAALNIALAASSGQVVVRCDAHAVLPPGYVTRAVETLKSTGATNVGGRQVPRGKTMFERAVGLAMVSPVGAGDARYRLGGAAGPVDTVYLGVFRRSAVEEVGGFDETLERNQDYELNWRLRQAGGVIWFDPRLAVDYRPRGSVGDLWLQYFEYGRWKRAVIRRHPESWRWRQSAAPALVVGLGASAFLAAAGSRLAGVIPAAYLATTLGAAGRHLATAQLPEAILEPVALWTMHLAWGIGFIVGPPGGRP
jgi:succinoglycan biosynthesis protein ExoA